jgi:hypothetical protein
MKVQPGNEVGKVQREVAQLCSENPSISCDQALQIIDLCSKKGISGQEAAISIDAITIEDSKNWIESSMVKKPEVKPVLGYWAIRGLGAPIRYLLTYCKVDFDEQLYQAGPAPDFSKACWYEKKFSIGLDFPNLPYFFDGDAKLTETDCILRFIATKYRPSLLGISLEE